MVKGEIDELISKLKHNFKQPTGKVLQNVDVKACLSDLHNKYVFVPADRAPNNVIIICKRYYIETLIKELGLDSCSTPTETQTTLHVKCHLKTLSIPTILSGSLLVFSCLTMTRDYLTYIGPPSCIISSETVKRFYKTVVPLVNQNTYSYKDWARKYCVIKTSHTGVNNMWILKNSTNLLSLLSHLKVHRATSIQTFDPVHFLLRSRMSSIINRCF